MNLIPYRKLEDILGENTNTIQTIKTTVNNEITNQVDVRNIGKFDYRLRIPVGTDRYD
jgi:hypothetical protein